MAAPPARSSALKISSEVIFTEKFDRVSTTPIMDKKDLKKPDWKWQMKNSVTNIDQISSYINLTPAEEEGIKRSNGRLKVSITPYVLSLIDPNDPNCPIRKQLIPTIDELKVSKEELVDPCGEDSHSPVPGLVHRYPDRVLFLITHTCAVYCRYCTRSRIVGDEEPSKPMSRENFEKVYEYLKEHTEVRDVLISGGDPLMLKTKTLEYYIKKLRSLEHIEIIRIGTKIPSVMPMRIDDELVNMLKKYHPFYMSIHFSHPKELTPEVKEACERLANAGIPLGSQTVLLNGVNDNADTMKTLMHELMKIRVRPYYLYQCDPVVGTNHLRTPVSVGIDIIENLRGHTTGYAVPTLVIDAPGGGGKIPIGPEYMVSRSKGKVTLRNYEGKEFTYSEPG